MIIAAVLIAKPTEEDLEIADKDLPFLRCCGFWRESE